MKKPNPFTLSDSGPRIAAAYIRASTDQQEDSPATQRAIIEEYAAANGYVIPADLWYVDAGISGGTPMQERPAGKRLLAAVMDKKRRVFHNVIIVRLDRAFREIEDQSATFKLLLKHDCPFVGAKQDLTAETAMQRGMLSMWGVMAQVERGMAGERVREKHVIRHHAKLHTKGVAALGLVVGEKSNDPLRIHEAELKSAIRVFEIFVDTGGNINETARRLNAEQAPTRKGGPWHLNTVLCIIRGANYRQCEHYGGELIEKPDLIPETIPAATLARANAILAAQYGHWHKDKTVKRAHSSHLPYTSLIQCGVCGRAFYYSRAKPPRQTSGRFACAMSQIPTAEKHRHLSIHAPAIDQMLGRAIKERLEMIEGGLLLQTAPKRQAATKQRTATQQRQAIAEQQGRLLDIYVEGKISQETWSAKNAKLQSQLNAIEDDAPEEALPSSIDLQIVRDLLAAWDTIWSPDPEAPEKRELLVAVLRIPPRGITLTSQAVEVRGYPRVLWTISAVVPILGPQPVTASRDSRKFRLLLI